MTSYITPTTNKWADSLQIMQGNDGGINARSEIEMLKNRISALEYKSYTLNPAATAAAAAAIALGLNVEQAERFFAQINSISIYSPQQAYEMMIRIAYEIKAEGTV